jgi:hypothetical protein
LQARISYYVSPSLGAVKECNLIVKGVLDGALLLGKSRWWGLAGRKSGRLGLLWAPEANVTKGIDAAAEHTHRDYVNGVGAVVARMDDAQVCGWATTTALSVRSGSEVNETVNLLS